MSFDVGRWDGQEMAWRPVGDDMAAAVVVEGSEFSFELPRDHPMIETIRVRRAAFLVRAGSFRGLITRVTVSGRPDAERCQYQGVEL